MRHLYMVMSAAALTYFSYAQHQGMTLYSGADTHAQQSSGARHTGGGTSTVSHK